MNQPGNDKFDGALNILGIILAMLGIAILCSAGIVEASYVALDVLFVEMVVTGGEG